MGRLEPLTLPFTRGIIRPGCHDLLQLGISLRIIRSDSATLIISLPSLHRRE